MSDEFAGLLRIIERETEIQAGPIEKEYWIMHILYDLQNLYIYFCLAETSTYFSYLVSR